MEVAGTAVGVVSLGITCCQGLVKYYDAWRGQNETVATTCDSITDLSSTLLLLRDTTIKAGLNPNIVKQVEKSFLSCENGINALNKKLNKINRNRPSVSIAEKIRAEGRKALYPFKESTLLKLRETVQDIRDNLALALEVLQLWVGQH